MNMSFSMTTDPFRRKIKTVTRRDGWDNIKLGEIHHGIEKGQGLKRGEHVVVIHDFIPTSSRWEPLQYLLDDPEYGKREVILEGFPNLTPAQFVDMLCKKNKCTPDKLFNRIEFKYVEES